MRKNGDFSYHILFGSQDKRLSEEAYRHWAQIVERRYDFYREKRCAFPSVTFSASFLFESCVPLSLLHCREFQVPQTRLVRSRRAPLHVTLRLPTRFRHSTCREVAVLRTLTKEDLLSFWDTHISAATAPARRKLAVYVHSSKHADTCRPDVSERGKGVILVESMEALRKLKRGLSLFPAPGEVEWEGRG